MITAIEGPLISQPQSWVLVFNTRASSRVMSWVALGHYKHVRVFGYVPFLHVWVFFDPIRRGHNLFLAADGEASAAVITAWIEDADLIRMRRCQDNAATLPPLLGFCVPAIKHLIGLRSSALRPDALWKHCIRNGGVPFEAVHGHQHPGADIQPAAA